MSGFTITKFSPESARRSNRHERRRLASIHKIKIEGTNVPKVKVFNKATGKNSVIPDIVIAYLPIVHKSAAGVSYTHYKPVIKKNA